MQISVEKNLFVNYPGFHLGIIILNQISNNGKDQRLSLLLENIEKLLQLDSSGMLLKRRAEIYAANLLSPEKAAYEESGIKPEHYHSNVEEMMKVILQGRNLKSSSKLEDCARYISLKFIAPIGVFDSDRINGDISLCLKNANSKDVVFKDKKSIFSEGWSNNPDNRAGISEKTINAVVFVYGISPLSKISVIEILHELKEVFGMFCSVMGKEYVLSVVKRSVKG